MKPAGSLGKFIAYGIAVGAGFLISSAQAKENYAVVRAVRGTASYSKDAGKTWKPVKVAFYLQPGTTVRTGVASTVDLFLGVNGPVVRITPDTELGLDKLYYEQNAVDTVIETELNLTNGRILGNVRKLAEASRYEVKTPVGVAGIRGTEYDISVDGTVRILTGSAVMVYANPQNPNNPSIVTIHEGEMARKPGQPGQPVTTEPIPEADRTQLAAQFQELTVLIRQPNPKPHPESPFFPPTGEAPREIPTLQPEPFVSPNTGVRNEHRD